MSLANAGAVNANPLFGGMALQHVDSYALQHVGAGEGDAGGSAHFATVGAGMSLAHTDYLLF